MSDLNWITQIMAWNEKESETFKLTMNANEIISVAEDTFTIFDEEMGAWVEHEGCEVYIHDCFYKILNSYEEFLKLIQKNQKGN